jgi:hypothetical protein
VHDFEIVAEKTFCSAIGANDLTAAIEHNHCRPTHLEGLERRVNAGKSESSGKLGDAREVPREHG